VEQLAGGCQQRKAARGGVAHASIAMLVRG